MVPSIWVQNSALNYKLTESWNLDIPNLMSVHRHNQVMYTCCTMYSIHISVYLLYTCTESYAPFQSMAVRESFLTVNQTLAAAPGPGHYSLDAGTGFGSHRGRGSLHNKVHPTDGSQ